MVIVEQFFHLNEQNHILISNLWRVLPMIFIVTGSLCGIVYAFVFAKFKERFHNRCVFFSDLYDRKPISTVGGILRALSIKTGDIRWSSDETCYFLQFTPIFCSIFGFVLLALYVMCGKGGNSTKNGLRAPWRIVAPSLICSVVFAILCIISLRYFNHGIYMFCNDYVETYGPQPCADILNNVSEVVHLDALKQHQRFGQFFQMRNMLPPDLHSESGDLLTPNDLVYLSGLFLGIAMSAWILCALFLLIRIVTIVDFQLIRITVKTVEILDQGFPIIKNDTWYLEKREKSDLNDFGSFSGTSIFKKSTKKRVLEPKPEKEEELVEILRPGKFERTFSDISTATFFTEKESEPIKRVVINVPEDETKQTSSLNAFTGNVDLDQSKTEEQIPETPKKRDAEVGTHTSVGTSPMNIPLLKESISSNVIPKTNDLPTNEKLEDTKSPISKEGSLLVIYETPIENQSSNTPKTPIIDIDEIRNQTFELIEIAKEPKRPEELKSINKPSPDQKLTPTEQKQVKFHTDIPPDNISQPSTAVSDQTEPVMRSALIDDPFVHPRKIKTSFSSTEEFFRTIPSVTNIENIDNVESKEVKAFEQNISRELETALRDILNETPGVSDPNQSATLITQTVLTRTKLNLFSRFIEYQTEPIYRFWKQLAQTRDPDRLAELSESFETASSFELQKKQSNKEEAAETSKTVKFKQGHSVYHLKGSDDEDDNDTETEVITHSIDQSSATLASPEPSEEGIELLELEDSTQV